MEAEEILTDELSEDHVYILNTTPKLKDWIIDAMKVYANQKLDQAAEICLETNYDNREYFDNFPDTDWQLDNNGHLFRVNKNGILALKDDI